jgi:predicted RNase H-like nuclease
MRDAPTFVGVDGCRGGWLVVRIRAGNGEALTAPEALLLDDFAAVLALRPAPLFVAVDMPIGLLTIASKGGRSCDQAARALLGPRRSSVFSPPLRSHLKARDWSEVSGLSKQSFHLLPKIREVDHQMTPALQQRVRETHPELAFRSLSGEAMQFGKRTTAGQCERLLVLEAALPGAARCYRESLAHFRRRDVARDDILDAMVLAAVARRMATGAANRVPRRPFTDARGLRMEIWS